MVDVQPVPAPERTLVQRMDALQVANEIRAGRARWKRDVKRGAASELEPLERSASAAMRDEPDLFDSMKVFDMLIALPRVGRVKANKILVQGRISPSKTLGGLSQRQRSELLMYVGPYVRRGMLAR